MGDWDAVMAVVARCMAALGKDSDRIYAPLKVDYRKGKTGRIKTKVAALKRHMA